MLRVGVSALVLAFTVVIADRLGDARLVLGPGYHALDWAINADPSVVAIVALGTLRVLGTAATIGGGGVGGLFIPLVIQGALVGRAVGGLVGNDESTLFPVVGMAAFLGAGYRVPLAAVVFVAEFTGRPGFVVPGLIAAVVAQMVVGRSSISPYQVARRVGHLETRLRLPLEAVVDTEARVAPPDITVSELFWHHLVGARQLGAVIVDGSSYLGVVSAEDLVGVPQEEWSRTPAMAVMRTDGPVAELSWTLADAVRVIESSGVDLLAVCDEGRYVGIITARDLVELDKVIDAASGPH